MSYSGGYGDYGLETIEVKSDGTTKIPVTRMRSADQVQDFGRRLWENDEKRSRKRGLVNGLVGGFPPFKYSKMRDAGQANNCNVNWGSAGSLMESGSGAFYDLSNEAPGVVLIKTSHGNDDQRVEWSSIMSEEADKEIHADDRWDYEMQRSQWEMTLHGCGPLLWEDAFKVFPRSVACGDFKVSERTKSEVSYYEVAWIDVDYYPPELYEFIKDEKTAEQAGYNVDYTKRVIANAMDIRQPEQRAYDWEFYQQEIKNNSLSYYDDSKVVHVGFCFFKEFDGRITQCIVERETTTGVATQDPNNPDQRTAMQFIFRHVGRYDNFQQAMSAMYYDRGNGGFHHAVTGAGSKMYGAMEHQNRMLCRMMDGVFAPKVLFKPTSTEVSQKMQLIQMGHFGVMPGGWDVVQNPISGFITEGLEMNRESTNIMRSNLSAYRQQAEPQKPGNPETKFGRQMDAFNQSTLSKTTFNRYYKQLDILYREIVRRMFNINSENEISKRVRKRCEERGVPVECFGRIESVEAIRIVGEGNALLRKSTLMEMQAIVPSLPEEGQNNWRNDFIAATAGQKAVNRYNPPKKAMKLATDQQANAMLQVAAMKIGTPPVITSSQNALTYAGTFLSACVQALQSIKQGGNPQEVLRFLSLCAPACIAHIKRIANDPLRKGAVMQIWKQIQSVQKQAKQIEGMVRQHQQQMRQQQQKTQAAMTDEQLATRKLLGDERRRDIKTQSDLRRKNIAARQQMALNDATTASNIDRTNRLAAFSE
jgi:hypothetical protein